MEQVDLLEGILIKTGDLIAGVRSDQWDGPTPCTEYNVRQLVAHMVGWVQVFSATARGLTFEGDPSAYVCGEDPAGDFVTASKGMVVGWREHGFDRSVRLTGGELPAQSAFDIALMEYQTHGWDVAKATGQQVPFSDAEAAETLARAEAALPAQYRGEGKAFAEIVSVPPDAPPIDRLVGFLGRQP